jgi:hypothetical protein
VSHAELNRHIARDWELLDTAGQSVGSSVVSFDVAGNVSSSFMTIEALSHPDSCSEDEILRPRDVVTPRFSSLGCCDCHHPPGVRQPFEGEVN